MSTVYIRRSIKLFVIRVIKEIIIFHAETNSLPEKFLEKKNFSPIILTNVHIDKLLRLNSLAKQPFEPAHEIMTLFVLRKLVLKTYMRSHPDGLYGWCFGRTLRLLPYFMCANSKGSGETVRLHRLA